MKKKLNIHLYVTDECNLKCNHCYNSKWVNNKKTKKHLSLQEIIQIITTLYNNYNVDFHIEGGETFLWKDMSNLLTELDDNILRTITLTTNGTIDVSHLSHQLKKLNNIRVSVCGHTDEMQKIIRNTPIKKILNNVNLLRNTFVPINLRMTLHKENFKEIFNSIDYFINENHKSISIYEFQNVGRGLNYESRYLMNEPEFIEFLIMLSKQTFITHLDSFRINFNSSRLHLINQYKQKLELSGLKIKELDNEHSLTINYNGELGICPWLLGDDTLSNFDINTFRTQIEHYYKNNLLLHECNHCSAISIYK